jgi:uncharacterized protein
MAMIVTGATGFVGRRLLAKLPQAVVLSRDAARAAASLHAFSVPVFDWNPQQGPPPAAAFEGVDCVFHLAGDPVAEGRWTAAKKQRIRESRVVGTRNLVAGLRNLSVKPRVLVSASAVGFYGSRGDEPLDEKSSPGSGFLAEVCQDWESAAGLARDLGIRVVPVRVGIVLGDNGGALAKMLPPFRFGLGSPLGNGRQFMPWVQLDDLVEMLLFAAREERVTGPLNGVSPAPVTNHEFTKTLGRVLGRPTILPPVPRWVLRTMLGEFADILLHSQRAYPRAAEAAGFSFQYRELEPALRAALKR